MGKKKKEAWTRSTCRSSAGMHENGYSDEAIKTLWDILVPFSDYAFNKAHTAGVRPGLLLDRLPQGELPGRVHGGAADLGQGRQGQDARSTSTSAAAWASRCCRRTSTSRTADFTPVGSDIRFGLVGDPQRRRQRRRVDHRGPQGRGEFTDFPDFLRKVDAVVCNKRTVESLIKAGAFDSLGHTRKGWSPCTPMRSTRYVDVKRNEAIGQFDLFGGVDDGGGEPSVGVAAESRPASGTSRSPGLRARDARAVRLRPPAVRDRARPRGRGRRHQRSPRCRRRARCRTARPPP